MANSFPEEWNSYESKGNISILYESEKILRLTAFCSNVDVIGVYCVDEAKQVFQYGLEHAQFRLVQKIDH